jgi:hypothetical protein
MKTGNAEADWTECEGRCVGGDEEGPSLFRSYKTPLSLPCHFSPLKMEIACRNVGIDLQIYTAPKPKTSATT